MNTKQQRQNKIKEIITLQTVTSQEDLLEKLQNNGFLTTQATLSRDLHEIGIVRVPDGPGFKYVLHQDDNSQLIRQIVGMEIINILHNESTIVVKTMPGRAQGVAIYLDKLHNSNIIGTIAGDDAIIIIPDSHKNITSIVAKLHDMTVGDEPENPDAQKFHQ
jgi:transcriptional regulator of arginine metabolism